MMENVMLVALVFAMLANVVSLYLSIRSINAYYRAHDLLLSLCLSAWRVRNQPELFPIYDDTIGSHWRRLMGRRWR